MATQSTDSGFPHRRTYAVAQGRNAILHPNGGFFELDADIVTGAEQELLKKALLVHAGIDEFNACERFAYQILKNTF